MKELQEEKPYYTALKDAEKLFSYYASLHRTDYQKMKHAAIEHIFPAIDRNERILDVGCGGGFYSLLAARKGGRDITLIDVEPTCVKAAKLNLLRNANLKVEAIVSSATTLPLRNSAFDFVLSVDLIEHLADDAAFLKEAHRVLKSEGDVLISTQNSFSLNNLIEGFFNRQLLRNRKWMGWDPAHLRFYNPKSLFSLLSNFGFKTTKVAGTYFIPYEMLFGRRSQSSSPEILKIARSFLKRLDETLESRGSTILFKTYGWGIICLCKKLDAHLSPNHKFVLR